MIDISEPQFDAGTFGLDEKTVNKHFHTRDLEGNWHKGIDAFVVIWETLGSLFQLLAI